MLHAGLHLIVVVVVVVLVIVVTVWCNRRVVRVLWSVRRSEKRWRTVPLTCLRRHLLVRKKSLNSVNESCTGLRTLTSVPSTLQVTSCWLYAKHNKDITVIVSNSQSDNSILLLLLRFLHLPPPPLLLLYALCPSVLWFTRLLHLHISCSVNQFVVIVIIFFSHTVKLQSTMKYLNAIKTDRKPVYFTTQIELEV